MNSGAEAVETALKLARRWGYKVKGIPENEALIIVAEGNFHGRTITIVTMSSDPDSYSQYGPFTPGFVNIPYDDTDALAKVLDEKGEPYPGYSVADCKALVMADSTKHAITWTGGDLSRFAGRPVRFRFKMKVATLFSRSEEHTSELQSR